MTEDGSTRPGGHEANGEGGNPADSGGGAFGHLIVERSGGIAGLLLVWDVDIDSSEHREQIGRRIAELPWQGVSTAAAAGTEGADGTQGADDIEGAAAAPARGRAGAGAEGADDIEGSAAAQARGRAGAGADRYVYVIESRFGLVRFGEAEMPGEFKSLVEQVREISEPERRRPGAN